MSSKDKGVIKLSDVYTMYGKVEDIDVRFDQTERRLELVGLLLPHYGGDDTSGLIEAARRLEEFIYG